jgi:hypothetical protein
MISLFSRLMDRATDAHFRRDPSGRLVFVPFGLKKKCYFVDSKSDEDKIRAFVKMYRSPLLLISWFSYPTIYLPGLFLDANAGLTPRGHRLAIALGVPLFFWLVLIALILMLWGLYRKTVPSVIASLSEVGPDVKGQLQEISRASRRVALGVAIACLGLMIVVLVWFVAWSHSLPTRRSPAAECPQTTRGDIFPPVQLCISKATWA